MKWIDRDSKPLVIEVETEAKMSELGARLAKLLGPGCLVLFRGELGAGKTTLIRGILKSLGWDKEVRSPTYNLFAVYEVEPPVLHADLFRVSSIAGTGIEDYLDSHACLVEWPEALEEIHSLNEAARVEIEFLEPDSEGNQGRRVTLHNMKLSNIEG